MRTFILLALFSLPAAAQTVYSWEDAEGVHFTDDLGQVPKDARNIEATQHARAPRQPSAVAPAPSPGTAVAASPATAAPARTEAGLDEREWRSRFVSAHRRIDTLQQGIQAREASLPPRTECVAQPVVPVGTVPANGPGAPVTTTPGAQAVAPPARCQVNVLHDRLKLQIAQEQVKLRDAQLDLENLERDASYAGVPREWRRGW